MDWIKDFQLFLFDFDGLLVNTEHLHFQAYIDMCTRRGYQLDWDFKQFSEAAHHSSTGLRDCVYVSLPRLYEEESDWSILYKEKKECFLKLIEEGKVEFMPGAEELLTTLQERGMTRCVVTHSAIELITQIRKALPLLNTIPHWITREDYSNAKPDPECYQIAIRRYSKLGDRIIGFEDTPRGWGALRQTTAMPVLICPLDSSYLPRLLEQKVCYFPTLSAISIPSYCGSR